MNGNTDKLTSFIKLVQKYRNVQQAFFALPKTDEKRKEVFKNLKALEKKVDEIIDSHLNPTDSYYEWLAR